MANSRIMLVCKHCGENFCIGKGYFGSYSTSNDELHKQLNIFYGEHEYGCCSEDTDCSDNARNHFAILEEGEDLGVLAADVVPKSEVEKLSGKYEDLKLKYLDLAKDHDELLAWGGHIKSTERAKIEKAVARKIIADMRELINGYENIDVYLDRIEKKYTEGKE